MLPSASIINIDPNSINNQTFTPSDEVIIPYSKISSSFNPESDNIEYFVYDLNNNILFEDYNFSDFKVNEKTLTNNSGALDYITLDPINDAINNGFDVGEIKTVYNFVKYQLGSNNIDQYYISEISSDRTELRLQSNYIPYGVLSSSFSAFSESILSNINYFDEFYLNFGSNNYVIAVNALLESSSLLIKLYEPLPIQYGIDSTLYIVNKPAESVAYKITFDPIQYNDNILYIKGPNYNLNIKNIEGVSTEYKTKNSITYSSISSSQFQINNLLKDKGVEINADYTDFSTFIHFSSISKRLENFYSKVKNIEDYQNNLNIILGINGSTSSSLAVSSSIITIKNEINNIISNFDGYEYYLYYESGSWAWPKSTSEYPYELESTSSAQVISWYSNIQESASIFDDSNQNNLIYTIPEFIREDIDNSQYESFIYMMGQFFDILWLYTKGITDKLNSDNRLLSGVSKDLVADVIKSLGTNTYNNNYALQNIYTSFIGIDSTGSYLPSVGNEMITDYIAVNSGSYPYSIDDVNKEIYKRLYHNISFILKKKGTTQAIKELANIYGIPNTILRISEFGGKDQFEATGDYWQNTFNYAYTTDGTNNSTVLIPWKNLKISNRPPESIMFRFKVNEFPPTNYSQSLLIKNGFSTQDFSITLTYSGSLSSGSYSGSIPNPYNQYGNLNLVFGGLAPVSTSIYLPFFNQDWWTVCINKPSGSNTATLYAQNKLYNGYDGNILGFIKSSSITDSSINNIWIASGSLGLVSGSSLGVACQPFSGSIQEFRYYNYAVDNNVINSFTLNPLSIEGNDLADYGSILTSSAYINLAFRAPLGSLLDSSSLTSLISMHPAISGYGDTSYGFTISSFADNTSTYNLGSSFTYEANTEYMFIKEPVAGIRNRVNNKIELENNQIPGNTVSNLISLEQKYPYSSSYTKDINYLEVVFSPQNEVNNDISNQLGGFNVGEFISPSELYGNSSATFYPELRNLSEDYFKKYSHPYDIWDYIRLIKFYDNSLFKLIKDFIPARTALSSGILIKQHLLERNRYPLPNPVVETTITSIATGSNNELYTLGNVYLTASINGVPLLLEGQKIYSSSNEYSSNPVETIEGGTGGIITSSITQSWGGYNNTPLGLVPFSQSTQEEFYNGEFSGSNITVTQQRLVDENCEILLYAPTTVISYKPILFKSSNVTYDFFLSANTIPSSSELYLFYDTGSENAIPYVPSYVPSFNG